ncbi:MAG: hypothetical protein QOG34_1129, partial [Frankiaceae bacterium]|nr:hypothetical protein [Frankiaceae bacterium]
MLVAALLGVVGTSVAAGASAINTSAQATALSVRTHSAAELASTQADRSVRYLTPTPSELKVAAAVPTHKTSSIIGSVTRDVYVFESNGHRLLLLEDTDETATIAQATVTLIDPVSRAIISSEGASGAYNSRGVGCTSNCVDKQQCTTTTTVDPGYDACQEKKQMVEEAALLACEAAVDTDWIPFVGEAAATACAALVGTALLYACPDLDSSITTTRKCVTVHADP